MKFTQTLNTLLMSDKFLARSDYKRLVEDYAELNNFFQNQKAAKTLSYFCSVNGIPVAEVEPFLGCTNFKADKTGCDGFMTREYYEKNVLNKEH